MKDLPVAARGSDEDGLRHIREALDETLFVEAGAGTGKTSALVDRVVALVLSGRTLDRVAAITFTEKAAAELKDRVRQGMEACLRERPESKVLVRAALQSLDRARISTIHSFCQDLLCQFAAEARVDPSFEVQDEGAAARRFSDRWRAYVEGLAGDEEASATIDRVLGLGMNTDNLEQLARELASKADLLSVLRHPLPQAPLPEWGRVPGYAERLQGMVPTDVQETDELRIRLETLASLAEELVRHPTEREIVLASATSALAWKFGRCGDKATWGAALGEARTACEQVKEGLAEILAACRGEALSGLVPLIARFVEEDITARGRDGMMTFDDLILRVRDLVADNKSAVRAFRERFSALLIDEFQDTDPLQVDIAMAFATNPGTGEIEPGRLFLVGDPKQSIYRFRRADMGVYSSTRQVLEAAGAGRCELRRNRRSRPEIIEWVNRVFAEMIGTGSDLSVQPAYREIRPSRDGNVVGPAVACLGAKVADGSNARQIRTMESHDVAACCRAIVAEKWEIVEKSGEVRPAAYKDIAILIPTRTGLTGLERALSEARVPYRVEGGSLIYRTQEVRDLLNCLTAIDDPADEVAIVGALRSPAFACSDLDLARFVSGGGRFNYLRGDLKTANEPVVDSLRVLRHFHERRQGKSLAALVEEFVTDRRLAEIGILDRRDRNSFRRMRYMVERTRAFEANGPQSLRALVQWLEDCSLQQMLDYEGAGLDDDEDAVRVLTVHGAKGLEFPIVIMAGMGSAPNSRTGSYLVDRSDESIAIQVGSKANNRFAVGDVDHLKDVEKRHCEAEFRRLLYVGATRARDHLVVSLYRKAGATKAAAEQLENNGARDGAHVMTLAPADAVVRRPFEGVIVDAPPASTGDAFQEQRRTLVTSSRMQTYTSATRLRRTAENKDSAEDDTEPWSRGRAGTRLGRAVHAAIQSLPLDPDDAAVQAFSRAQAVAEAIPERAAEVARLVSAAFSSRAAQRAREAPRALREVPFALAVDEAIVEGFVDMIIEGPEGLEIVDWKTDRIAADADVQSRLAEYELQAGLYVLGIEAATGQRVNSVTYVFVAAGREESPGDPASLAQVARSRVTAP